MNYGRGKIRVISLEEGFVVQVNWFLPRLELMPAGNQMGDRFCLFQLAFRVRHSEPYGFPVREQPFYEHP